LKEYHFALDQLYHQKQHDGTDADVQQQFIESLKAQIQELKEEKKLSYQNFQRELLGVSNAFHCFALQRTLEPFHLYLHSQQQTNDKNNGFPTAVSFEIPNDSFKGKENVDGSNPKGFCWAEHSK